MKLGVAYYRESTTPQGKPDRNGLTIQKIPVRAYCRYNKIRLIREFVELKSGGNRKRIDVQEAIDLCAKRGATLYIAKQDRLGRDMEFIVKLMNSPVPFVAVDDPFATDLTKHIKAAFDEYERKKKSERAKETARLLKEKGVKLGTNGKKLSRYYRRQRTRFDRKLAPLIRRLKKRGWTVQAITDELNRRGIPTPRHRKWHLSTVHGIMKRNGIL
jgi:DNA invertase Pin-like site-specific DNA recombinase